MEAECGERAWKAERMKEEMRMKIELARIQLEIEAAAHACTAPDNGHVRVMANEPKLQTFEEKCDELAAYLERFERFTVSQHWNKED